MKKVLLTLLLLRFIGALAQDNTDDSSWKKIYRAEATRINDLVNTTLEVNFDFISLTCMEENCSHFIRIFIPRIH
jgi:hypothetical protein